MELGGKERGLKFNTVGLREAWREMPADGEELKYRAAIIWGGLKGNDYAKKQEADYTWEDVTEWVDDLFFKKDNDTLKKIVDAMQESQAYLSLLPKNDKEEDEKKSQEQTETEG